MADQAKFLSFLDMIDGGGAGDRGDKFEGGGIFSAIANMIAKPYGSEDEGRKRARMRALGLLDTQPTAAPAPVGRIGDNAPKPMLRPSAEDRLMQQPVKPMSAEDRLMGMPVKPNQMYTQAAAEAAMGLTPFGGSGVKDVYGIGRGGEYAGMTPIPQPPAVSTEILGQQPVYTIDQYLRSINVPITPQTRAQYMPQLMAQFGLNR